MQTLADRLCRTVDGGKEKSCGGGAREEIVKDGKKWG